MSLSKGYSTLRHRCRGCHRLDYFFLRFFFRAGFWHHSSGIPHSSHPLAFFSLRIYSLGFSGLHSTNSICSLCRPPAFVISLLSLQPHLPKFWCQSSIASVVSQGYPCMALSYTPILLFLFFFPLDIYRPDRTDFTILHDDDSDAYERTELHGWTNERCAFLLSYPAT